MRALGQFAVLCAVAAAAGCGAHNPANEMADLQAGGDSAGAPNAPDDLGADLGGADLGRPTFGAYVLYETFNAMPTAATPNGPALSVQASGGGTVLVREVPFAADKSAQIAKPAAGGGASLTANFSAQS